MAYLLDSDVFIQAKNLHYPMDVCPGFWDWIQREHSAGKLFSIEKVGDELQGHDDELATWAKKIGPGFFLRPDAPVNVALPKVSGWATSQQYEPPAVNVFFNSADYYLAAQALAHNHVVVTHEVASDGKKIKIPNVCIGVGVKCMTPFEMLRLERARFILAAGNSGAN